MLARHHCGSLLCCQLRLAERLWPTRFDRRAPKTKFALHLVDVLFPPLLPVDSDEALGRAAALDRPGNIVAEELLALGVREGKVAERRSHTRHGNTEVSELEEFDCEFSHDIHWHPEYTMVEVVALPVALHDVRELGVVHVVHLKTRLAATTRDLGRGHGIPSTFRVPFARV